MKRGGEGIERGRVQGETYLLLFEQKQNKIVILKVRSIYKKRIKCYIFFYKYLTCNELI